jgi:hypothetical protein
MKTVYLVVKLDVSKSVPVVDGLSVRTERSRGLHAAARCYFELEDGSGVDFPAARADLLAKLRARPDSGGAQ